MIVAGVVVPATMKGVSAITSGCTVTGITAITAGVS